MNWLAKPVNRVNSFFRRWIRILRYRIPWRVRQGLLVILGLQCLGTVAYPLIEGSDRWGYFDGAYFTAITLATIGFGEIPHELSKPGRAFTIVLAYGGIFTLAFFASELVRTVVSGELQAILGKERMEEGISRLSGHLIVCGYGRMGKIICDQLEHHKEPYVVIDTGHCPTDWPAKFGFWLAGNATEDEVLRKAGLERAKALISAVGTDADNLYITLSARLINSKVLIVARAEEVEAESKLRKVGANKIVSPYLAGGQRAVQSVLRPMVLNFLDMTSRPELLDLQLEEIPLLTGSKLAGETLRSAALGKDYGVTIVCLMRSNGELVYSPHGETLIEAGMTLVVLGPRRQLDQIEKLAASA